MTAMANFRPLDIETLGQRIRYAREAKGLTQEQVADHFGIRRVSVTQWENDTTKPALAKVKELAELLDTETDWLLERKGVPPLTQPRSRPVRPPLFPGETLVGERDLPIYAAAMGGDGHLIVNFEAIDYVKRPSALQNVKGGYGILVVGGSMIPAYRPNDVALVHPNLAPARDTDVVLFHTPPAGAEAEAMIKRLLGMNDRQWSLEQYNPHQEFSESRVDWPICHRVVGKYNAR